MICVAISDKNPGKCLEILDRVELAEIRIDLTMFGPEEIKKVFSHPTPTIATCRPDTLGREKQLELLCLAIESGAKYVDIEIEADEDQKQKIIDTARKKNCRVIVSYHNFQETPGLKQLYQITDECFAAGADVAKIATMVTSQADCARLLSLYSNSKPMVVLGMGEPGKITRIMSPFLGAEFTFAAMDEGEATAPGQITYSKMKEIEGYIRNEIGK